MSLDTGKIDNKIKTCQKYLLILLKFLHEICERNGIKYTLDAGTLIGAVRDKGFIPWDDDLDVTLVRYDYDRLINILKEIDLPSNIGIDFPEERKDYMDFNIRLYIKDVVIRDDEASMAQYGGIFAHPVLDIFVMDGYPTSKLKRRLFVLYQQIIFGLAMSKRNQIKIKKYKTLEKIGIAILSKIGKTLSMPQLCAIHEKYSKMYFGKNTEYLYCTGWSPEYPGYVYRKEWYDKVHLTKFEDDEFYIADHYDEILTCGYGDWKKPIKTHDHEKFIENL